MSKKIEVKIELWRAVALIVFTFIGVHTTLTYLVGLL